MRREYSHRAAALYSVIVLVTLPLFSLITPEWSMSSAEILLASGSIHALCADATGDPEDVQKGQSGGSRGLFVHGGVYKGYLTLGSAR